jgi:hypothetical protein
MPTPSIFTIGKIWIAWAAMVAGEICTLINSKVDGDLGFLAAT